MDDDRYAHPAAPSSSPNAGGRSSWRSTSFRQIRHDRSCPGSDSELIGDELAPATGASSTCESMAPLTTALLVRQSRGRRALWRHLNHADRRAPAPAPRLHPRWPAFGGAAERAHAMPRRDKSRLTAASARSDRLDQRGRPASCGSASCEPAECSRAQCRRLRASSARGGHGQVTSIH
jgi:hypothetical protein